MEIADVKFEAVYNNKILKLLDRYERDRKILLKKAHPLAITYFLCGVLGAVFFYYSGYKESCLYMTICLFVAVLVPIFHYMNRDENFKESLKYSVLNSILSLFGQLYWTNDEIISAEEIRSLEMAPFFKHKLDDDSIVGQCNGVNLSIVETCLYHYVKMGKRRYQVTDFKGIIVKMSMNKRFSGFTLVKSKSFLSKLTYSGYEKIVLEDPDFNSKYDVYSNDQVEARYLLTTAFIERMLQLQTVFSAGNMQCVFKDSHVYFFLETKKNFFEVGNLFTTLKVKNRYSTVYNELISITNLIEHFKLNQYIGL